MKTFFVYFLSIIPVFAQKIITLSPQIERQSQRYVDITKVELTDKYTIVHFYYRHDVSPFSKFFGKENNNQYIEIDPDSYLYASRNLDVKYKFIKAEGITVAPKQLVVEYGDEVKFKVYFDRLEPGVEVFNFFEGKDNPKDGKQFWNFYGVRIRNPKTVKTKIPQDAKPEIKKIPPVAVVPPVVESKSSTASTVPSFSTVRGTILDAKTKQPIAAKLSYVVPNDDKSMDSLQLSTASGKFKLLVAPNQKYGYTASAKGYFPSSGEFDLTKMTLGQDLEAEILLSPVAVGEAIRLDNIYFSVSKYDLLPSSFLQLDQLVKWLQDNPKSEIRVEGHTDSAGDFDENVKLSLNRANAVKKYLIDKGIESVRVEAKGFGPTRPATKGTSDAERQKNRRVEFVVVKI